MPDKIIHIRSLTPGSTPTTSSLGVGEIAINVNDGKIFVRQSGSLGDTIQTAVTTNSTTTGSVRISGSVQITGSLNAPNITGSLFGTSSWANNVISSSFAISASWAPTQGIDTSGLLTTSSFNSYTGSNTSTFAGTASFAITASQAISSSYSSFAQTSSYAINMIVSGGLMSASYIDFNLNPGVADAVGRLKFDSGEGTLQLGLVGGNVTCNIGEDLFQYVYNNTGAILSKGQVVYISGSQGNRIAVKLASATAEQGSANTLGFVAETIAIGAEGWVQTEGTLRKLDTTGLIGGQLLYLSSSAGQYTQTKPQAPIHEVRLGYAERIDNNVGSIYVKIDNGYELDELHNVRIISESFGDLLMYSSSLWINSRQLTGSYGLTGSLNATSFTGSLFGTASFALSASWAPPQPPDTSTLVTTSSFNSYTGSNTSTFAGTASFAQTSSFINPLNQTLQVTGTITGSVINSAGDITTQQTIRVLSRSGDEGGEIFLTGSVTNTSISGGVVIDVYQDKLRFFEQGGSNRGFFVNITSGSSAVNTNLQNQAILVQDLTTYTSTAGTTTEQIMSNNLIPGGSFKTNSILKLESRFRRPVAGNTGTVKFYISTVSNDISAGNATQIGTFGGGLNVSPGLFTRQFGIDSSNNLIGYPSASSAVTDSTTYNTILADLSLALTLSTDYYLISTITTSATGTLSQRTLSLILIK